MNRRISIICITILLCTSLGAQQVRDSLELSKGSVNNTAQMIQGLVSGVRVSAMDGSINGDYSVNIRGVNSFRTASQPLWIVDGIRITADANQNADAFFQFGEQSYSSTLNTLAFLNPYEIESIDVIKDISAAAVYGPDAANGVIVVKTKMSADRPVNIEYHGNFSTDIASKISDIFRPGLATNHQIAASGSKNKSAWRLSAWWKGEMGPVQNQSYSYGGANLGFETRANNVVWCGIHAQLSIGNMNSTTGPSYFGKPSLMLLARTPYLFPDNSVDGWRYDYDDKNEEKRALNTMFLHLNFTPYLRLKIDCGADYRNNTRKIWYGNGTSFGKEQNGAASILSQGLLRYNGTATLEFENVWDVKEHFKADLAFDVNGKVNRFNTMNGTDFFTHSLRAEGLSLMGSKANIHTFDCLYNNLSGYAFLSYDHKKMFGLDMSLRAAYTPGYDRSKVEFYPSGNLFVDLKKIALPQVGAISSFKISAGYGKAANEEIIPYQLFQEYTSTAYAVAEPGTEPFYKGFNRLVTRECNVALEMSFLKNRLGFNLEFYDKHSSDSFSTSFCGKKYKGLWEYTDPTTLYSTVGTIGNRGVELSLNGVIIRTKDIRWKVEANFSYNSCQITSMDESEREGKKIGNDMYVNINALGNQVGALYGYLENPDGSYKDVTGDGVIDLRDRQILGNAQPAIMEGLSSTFEWKNLKAEILFDAAQGHYIADLNSLLADRKNVLSSSYVKAADFFRLSKLSVGYSIPVKAKKIRDLQIVASARNLFCISKYDGWNPDANCFGRNVSTQGVDYGSYPMTRTFLLGISLKF